MKRGIVRLAGTDALRFLNGLTTNSVTQLKLRSAQYTNFLNSQGRLLFDAFVWRTETEEVLVECDRRIVNDLMLHLKQYVLRRRLTIHDVSDKYSCVVTDTPLDALMSIDDPRGAMNLKRHITDKVDVEDLPDYDQRRFEAGVPEGPVDIPRGQPIPLEYGMDWLGAIDFHKGCYLGQELIARTHNKGVIRKRLMPCRLLKSADELFCFDADFKANLPSSVDLQGAGKVVSTLGNLALALIRLQDWQPGKTLEIPERGLLLQPARPGWWPDAV